MIRNTIFSWTRCWCIVGFKASNCIDYIDPPNITGTLFNQFRRDEKQSWPWLDLNSEHKNPEKMLLIIFPDPLKMLPVCCLNCSRVWLINSLSILCCISMPHTLFQNGFTVWAYSNHECSKFLSLLTTRGKILRGQTRMRKLNLFWEYKVLKYNTECSQNCWPFTSSFL